MKQLKKLLPVLALIYLVSCTEDSTPTEIELAVASEAAPIINLDHPVHYGSITEIVHMQHAFYLIDRDNFMLTFNEGTFACPDVFDYDHAEYAVFDDLLEFSGDLALNPYDTLYIVDGLIESMKIKGPPGRATCKPGEITQGGSHGSQEVPVQDDCKSGKSRMCTVNTVSCRKSDGSVYEATGSPGNCGSCKKNSNGGKTGFAAEPYEYEDCGF